VATSVRMVAPPRPPYSFSPFATSTSWLLSTDFSDSDTNIASLLGLTYRALADRRVDVIARNSTDEQIAALDLVALSDDRGYFLPYRAAPVVRAATLEKYPAVAAALAELAGKISDAEMRRLNALADVEHQDIADIARAWLAQRVP
jgi:glycine betaine/choline ABC-type transport system substrate-binding protein